MGKYFNQDKPTIMIHNKEFQACLSHVIMRIITVFLGLDFSIPKITSRPWTELDLYHKGGQCPDKLLFF